MSKTLPPGWVGNLAHHHTDIAGLRLDVSNWPLFHDRTNRRRYRWFAVAPGNVSQVTMLSGPPDGFDIGAQARADGLSAIEAFARKLLEQAAQLRAGEL